MKYLVGAILVLLCFPFGQLAHKFLVGPYYKDKFSQEAKKKEMENIVEVEVATPGGKSVLKIDLRYLKEGEIPEKVVLTKRVEVSSEDGTTIALESGSAVRVIGREGNELLIAAMSGPLEGRAKMVATDLPRQIADARAAKLFGVVVVNEPEGGNPTPPVVTNDPPEKPPVVTPTPTPTPTPEPEPEPEPEPTPVAALTGPQIEELMQENIKGGGVKEFTFADVKGWKAGEEEEIDGETYQTGLAAYQAETIFGPKTVQAKALIKEGKIVKWVYAKTGMEIR